jgi:hypothetical protein
MHPKIVGRNPVYLTYATWDEDGWNEEKVFAVKVNKKMLRKLNKIRNKKGFNYEQLLLDMLNVYLLHPPT